MFLSKDELKLSYGVDLRIGEAFLNRPVPVENLYWANRKIYIPGAPGYYFMPIYADMLFRLGADISLLLSEDQFKLNELILHEAALVEYKYVSWIEHAERLCAKVEPFSVQNTLFNELKEYLIQEKPFQLSGSRLGTMYPSLNRADSYLLSLTSIKNKGFNLQLALAGWYALMTYFLLLDDLSDIEEDIIQNEENLFVDTASYPEKYWNIQFMINQSLEIMQVINPVMANRIDHRASQINLEEIFQTILMKRQNQNGRLSTPD